ncbi:small hydrophilic protein [Streptomyces sp. NPDC003016]
MAFSHRLATLAAVVAIPLGIAATSYALTDRPEPPKVPSKVELESTAPDTPLSSPRTTPGPTPGTAAPSTTPSDAVVPGPTATNDDADGPDDDTHSDDDDLGEKD